MFEVVQNPLEAGFSASTAKRLQDFASMMAHFMEVMETKDAYEFAETVMRQSGIMTAAALDRSPEGIDRKQNLDELLSGLHEFVQQRIDEGIAFTPIQDFLAEVSLLTDQDENIQDHMARVTLMTVHAAKGLEFASVHIVGLEEQLFPSQFCQSPAEIEEERRLLYVAITRAMKNCTLSFARSRFTNGSLGFTSQSRFLKDIDRQFLQLMDNRAPSTQRFSSTPNIPRTSSIPRFSSTPSTPMTPSSPTTSPIPSDWNPGDRIMHRVFGKGQVLRVYRDEGTGNDKIDILFDEKGQKTLLLTYAKLERLS